MPRPASRQNGTGAPARPAGGDVAAVVLAGGRGRRLGGPGKPELDVGGRALLDRVLGAVAHLPTRVVVGPPTLTLPPGVLRTREEPPGGGPVAAAAAGLDLVPAGTTYVALLAADLPFLGHDAVSALSTAAVAPGADGAVFVDDTGRRQWLCGVWRMDALRHRLAALDAREGGLSGAALRELLRGLRVLELVAPPAASPPPWFDCDTEADLRHAKEWADGEAG